MKKLLLCCLLPWALQSCDFSKKDTTREHLEPDTTVTATSKNNIPAPTDAIIKAFYQAIEEHDDAKVMQLLTTVFPPDFKSPYVITPIQRIIAESDHVEAIKYLIENGADVEVKDSSLIELAVAYKRLETVKYLIASGVNLTDNEAFNSAGRDHFYEGAKLLLLHGANQGKGDLSGKYNFFLQAVALSDYEALDKLTDDGDLWNANNCKGETALILAIKQNKLAMVQYLLKKGSDKEKPETFDCSDHLYIGKKPLQIAKELQLDKIVEALTTTQY